MACFIIATFDIAINFDTTQIFYSGKKWLNCLGIFHSVQRYFRIRAGPSLLFVALLLKYGVFYLKLCSIEKDDLGYFSRRLRAVDLALVTVPHQLRQKSTVVKVGMGQKHGIEGLRGKRKWLPVSSLILPLLVHAAIYKHTGILVL
jgi:hypothetical protein